MKSSQLTSCMVASCSESPSPQQHTADSTPAISGDAVFAHVALLADDFYEGREAGKRGDRSYGIYKEFTSSPTFGEEDVTVTAALGNEIRAFYRSGRYHKSIELEERGADGAIFMQHRQIASEAGVVRGSKSDKYWSVNEHDGPKYASEGLQVQAFMLEQGARELFSESPLSFDEMSGVGTMLEVARALVNSNVRPKRSIIFVATVGEEKGLLGADFFASNPTVPIESIVANVNMDMVMLLWKAQDVVAFGADHSTLGEIVKRATDKVGIELSPDPFPERGYFTRSDQFPFVQQGVPAVFFATGFATQEPGVDPEALYNHFMKTHYHGGTKMTFLTISTVRN